MAARKTEANDIDVRIVILQRRWAIVGVYSRAGLYGWLHHAFVVRRWGTTEGIGQLAGEGPTQSTVLDRLPCGVEFFEPTVVCTFPCDFGSWRKALGL